MKQFIFVSTLLLCIVNSFDLFYNTPSSNFFLGNQSAIIVKIANDQSQIVVGYQNGAVQAFNSKGQLIMNFLGHNSSILDIEWVPNYGPISLDTSGKVILFNPNGTILISTVLNTSSATEMTMTSNNVSNFVGFNFGSTVQQYVINSSSMTFVKAYNAQGNTTFKRVYYSSGHQFLFAGTSNSQVQLYNCSSGSYANSSFSLNSNSTVQSFSRYGSNYVLMTTNSQFYSFNTNFNNTIIIGNASVASSTMVACPQSLYIVTGQTSTAQLDVYSGSFRLQQLDYLQKVAKSIDCSASYLVSVDSANYLAIDNYLTINIKLPPWAIGVIAGVGGLVVIAVVVGLIICAIRRRRAGLNAQINDSGFGKELISPATVNREQPYMANNFQQRF